MALFEGEKAMDMTPALRAISADRVSPGRAVAFVLGGRGVGGK